MAAAASQSDGAAGIERCRVGPAAAPVRIAAACAAIPRSEQAPVPGPTPGRRSVVGTQDHIAGSQNGSGHSLLLAQVLFSFRELTLE